MQVCTSLQTDNHAGIPPLGFYGPFYSFLCVHCFKGPLNGCVCALTLLVGRRSVSCDTARHSYSTLSKVSTQMGNHSEVKSSGYVEATWANSASYLLQDGHE